MSFPFYVNPQQMTQDKAEFARKGIARGKSIVTLEFATGILMVAENPLRLQKLGEIYVRIGFAGVGKFSEFTGCGSSVCSGRMSRATASAVTTCGRRPSRTCTPRRSVRSSRARTSPSRSRSWSPRWATTGSREPSATPSTGSASTARSRTRKATARSAAPSTASKPTAANYRAGLSLRDALRLGRDTLQRAENGQPDLGAEKLEVAILDRTRSGRRFRRLLPDEVREHLSR